MGKRRTILPPPSSRNPEPFGRANRLTEAWEQYRITHMHPEMVEVTHDRLLKIVVGALVELEERLSSVETKRGRRRKSGG